GMIVRLEGQRGLINIGRAHGVEKDMVFSIVKEGELVKDPETGEFSFNRQEVLGEFTVTGVGEMVSEGTYTYTGLYNRVNVYDHVVLKK
ncbi:MAG: hypothetical protein ACOC7U_10800, partial [Spirochaetota bacterium]